MNNNRSWIRRQFNRFTRNLRYRISGEGHAKPPDWFLDKFAAQTFTDPEEPLYQAKRSKLLCGLKLAFDPTQPAHYHVSALTYFETTDFYLCILFLLIGMLYTQQSV